MEVVIITKKRAYRNSHFKKASHLITVNKHLRNLGVEINTQFRFGQHVQRVSLGIGGVASAIDRDMSINETNHP